MSASYRFWERIDEIRITAPKSATGRLRGEVVKTIFLSSIILMQKTTISATVVIIMSICLGTTKKSVVFVRKKRGSRKRVNAIKIVDKVSR